MVTVHICGHLRVFVYYVLSTLVDTCECLIVKFVHFSGHLRTLVCYVLSTLVDAYARSPVMRCPLLWTPLLLLKYVQVVG